MKLDNPCIGKIRADLIIEKLNSFSTNFPNIRIAFTGRTGSGKTTCGNLLIGMEYFLKSTGHQDCTDEINLVEFSNGLSFIDLPGVASDDLLENYNRISIGLESRRDFPQVENLTITKYNQNQSVNRTIYNLNQWRQQKLNPDLKPNLIFYFIAPDKQFLREEGNYLLDLLRHNPNVIYVFNLFIDKNTKTNLVTPQNIEDCLNKVSKIHHKALGRKNNPVIVKFNCWTGEGLDELLRVSGERLGVEKGRLFKELLDYQIKKTPEIYGQQVLQQFLKHLSYLACQKPENELDEGTVLIQACDDLKDFIALVFNRPKIISFPQNFVQSKAKSVVADCIKEHYQPIKVKKSRKKPVVKYRTVYEDDYSNPITQRRYRPRVNLLGIPIGQCGYNVITGYNKKPVQQSYVVNETEYWEEVEGQELAGYTYEFFNQKAIIFLLTMNNLFVSELAGNPVKGTDIEARYTEISQDIIRKLSSLPNFPNPPQEAIVLDILSSHLIQLSDLFVKPWDKALLSWII